MARIITFLALFLALTAVRSNAIPTFSINPQCITPAVGDTVTLFVEVNDFTNIASFQYSMNWNPAVMQFVSVDLTGTVNLTDLSAGNFGITQATMGNLLISWNNSAAVGTTVPNASKIYRLRYKILTSTTPALSFSGSPTSIEVVTGTGNNVTPTFNNLNPASCGNNNNTGFSIIADDTTGNVGDTICVSITAQDFINIVSMQYSMHWDAAVLDYVGVQNFGLPDFSAANFNENNSSTLSMVWFDNATTGVTRANGYILYRVCFKVIGASGSSSTITFNGTPTSIEVASTSGVLPFQSDPGSVSVGGGGGNTDCPNNVFAVIFPDTCYAPGATICVPVKVRKFTSIASMQFSMHWNASQFALTGINGFNLTDLNASNFNLLDTINGNLPFLWFDQNTTGVTVPDGTSIFTLCFKAEGAVGASSDLYVNGSPTPIEVVNGSGVPVTPCFQPGTFSISNNCNPVSCSLTAAGVVSNVTCNGGSNGGVDLSVSGSATLTYSWSGNGGSFTAATQDITGRTAGTYSVTVTASGCTSTTATFVITQPTAVSITNVITDVACNGGASGGVNITVTGGPTGTNYSYLWSTTPPVVTQDLTNVAAGLYSVTVTTSTGSCTAVASNLLVTQPGLPLTIGNPVITNISCGSTCNGAIDINPTGGTGAYQYSWAGVSGNTDPQDRTNLCAGTYAVTVMDENQCTTAQSYTVSAAAAFNMTYTQSNPTCNNVCNGSINLTATGGNGTLTYHWSGTGVAAASEDQSNLCAGSYSVTVADGNGCTGVLAAIVLTQPQPLSIQSNIGQPTNGSNGTISFVVTGGTPAYNYNWQPAAGIVQGQANQSGLAAGTYNVTVSDANGCTNAQSVVLVPAVNQIVFSNIVVQPAGCPGQAIGAIYMDVTGGAGQLQYKWYNITNPNSVIGTSQDIQGLLPGVYYCVVMDANGQIVTLQPNVSVPGSSSSLNVNYIINPQTGSVTLGANGDILISVTGGTLPYTFSWSDPGSPNTEDRVDVLPGFYCVTVGDQTGCNQVLCVTVPYIPTVLVVPSNQIVEQDVNCNGDNDGSAEIHVQGGDAPYSLFLNDVLLQTNYDQVFTIDNLNGGNYTYEVQDSNGQSVNVLININEPAALDVPFTVTNAQCICNGSIILNPTGGTPASGAYNYNWSDGPTTKDRSGLCPGSVYSCTISDSHGCSYAVGPISISDVSTPLTISDIDLNNVICNSDNDGSITLTLSGGVQPFNIIWNDNGGNPIGSGPQITGLSPGNYDVSITDGCPGGDIIQQYTISATTTLSINNVLVTPTTGVGIADGAAQAAVTGGNPDYTYNWCGGTNGPNGTVTGLVAGPCAVTVTDEDGCVVESEFLVPSGSGPQVEITVNKNVSCYGECDGSATVNLTGGVGPFTYEWEGGSTLKTANNLCGGVANVTITDSNGTEYVRNVEITQPDPLLVNVIVTDATAANFADGSVIANVEGGTPPYTYLWNDKDQSITAQIDSLAPGDNYAVLVEDAAGCTELIQNINVGPYILISCFEGSVVITPNEDGKNDVFVVSCNNNYQIHLEIYNRWGQLMFISDDYQDDWKGYDDRGNALPEGGYFYVIEADEGNGVKQYKGAISLIREQ